MFNIKKIYNQEMDMNSYLLIKQKKAIVVDPGFNGEKILSLMKEKSLSLDAILLTHGHYDHIRDIEIINEDYLAKVYIHESDKSFLYNSKQNYALAFGQKFILNSHHLIKSFENEALLDILGEKIEIIHTPGHTLGSVMYKYKNHIFSGDTIFYDGIGRTDLFSGQFNALRRSLNMIKEKLSNKDMIYPGHGRQGLYKDIKEVNRFLQ